MFIELTRTSKKGKVYVFISQITAIFNYFVGEKVGGSVIETVGDTIVVTETPEKVIKLIEKVQKGE